MKYNATNFMSKKTIPKPINPKIAIVAIVDFMFFVIFLFVVV